MIDRMRTGGRILVLPSLPEPGDVRPISLSTNTSVEPPQIGSAVDVAAAPGGTFQPLLTTPPGKDLFLDLGSTGRVGVRARHL
jgi:hypothetical protein